MGNSITVKYDPDIEKVQTEDEMRALLTAFKGEYDKIEKLLKQQGPIKNFSDLISSILNGAAYITIHGPGKVFGIELSRDGEVRWDLTKSRDLLARYRETTENREQNCRFLTQEWLAQDEDQLCCNHPKFMGHGSGGYKGPVVSYFYSDSLTSCPFFEYNTALRIKGQRNTNPEIEKDFWPPKTLYMLFAEMFSFTPKFPREKVYYPPFVKQTDYRARQ